MIQIFNKHQHYCTSAWVWSIRRNH